MRQIKEFNKNLPLVIGQWVSCLLLLCLINSCSISKQISKQANNILLSDSAIRTGHIGISIYEPATNTYWYEHNADKYFIPASNTKLFTLYAGMKYLGDSLVAARLLESNNITAVYPSGDPTFLNSEFTFQPLFNYLKLAKKTIGIYDSQWGATALGNGWAWNDYTESYMVERSSFPLYNNLIEFSLKDHTKINSSVPIELRWALPSIGNFHFDPVSLKVNADKFKIIREYESNIFYVHESNSTFKRILTPFKTSPDFITDLLKDTLNAEDAFFLRTPVSVPDFSKTFTIYSQPSDSLFKPMMHRSDNFFAEQTLLMASNEHLGYMSDEKIIDTILKTSLKDVPQKPRWVDGSGLSRYNLFTPRSFVYILNKTKNEFGWERVKDILPTGGEGTLSSYFKKDSGFIYAKTGTLSNNCALSGYLITKKGKLLIFSVLNNNYGTGATPVRKAVEKFLLAIREKY